MKALNGMKVSIKDLIYGYNSNIEKLKLRRRSKTLYTGQNKCK